jgi:hypothetical protein
VRAFISEIQNEASQERNLYSRKSQKPAAPEPATRGCGNPAFHREVAWSAARQSPIKNLPHSRAVFSIFRRNYELNGFVKNVRKIFVAKHFHAIPHSWFSGVLRQEPGLWVGKFQLQLLMGAPVCFQRVM